MTSQCISRTHAGLREIPAMDVERCSVDIDTGRDIDAKVGGIAPDMHPDSCLKQHPKSLEPKQV